MHSDTRVYMKSKITQRTQLAMQTRERVVDVSMAMMAERGYSGTRLEDVAKAMSLTRGAIYGHFSSKAALYREILSYSQKPLYKVLNDALGSESDGLTTIRAFMLDWFSLLFTDLRHRHSTEIFLNKSEMIEEVKDVFEYEKKLSADMISGLETIIRKGIEKGEFRSDNDPRLVAIQIYGQVMGLMQSWLFNPELYDLEKMREPLVENFLKILC